MTPNIISFQMAVRVLICCVLWGYGCYNRLQWIWFIFPCLFSQNTLTISVNYCLVYMLRMKHSCKVLCVIALHKVLYHGDFSKQMIPCQGHFLLEVGKLISLLHGWSYLKASLFRNQTPSVTIAFFLIWLLCWCSI